MPKHRCMPPPNAQWRWRRTSPSLPLEISSPPLDLPAASSASHTELSARDRDAADLDFPRGHPRNARPRRLQSEDLFGERGNLCWVLAQLGPQLRIACEMQKRESDC